MVTTGAVQIGQAGGGWAGRDLISFNCQTVKGDHRHFANVETGLEHSSAVSTPEARAPTPSELPCPRRGLGVTEFTRGRSTQHGLSRACDSRSKAAAPVSRVLEMVGKHVSAGFRCWRRKGP